MNKLKIACLVAAFCVAIAFFGFKYLVVLHVSESNVEDSYVLNTEFPKVKILMIKNDVLEKIVEQEQGEIVGRKWNSFIFSGNRPLRDGVDIYGSGDFVVLKQDAEAGQLLLKFKQQIHVTKNNIKCLTKLVEPCGFIKNVETSTEMVSQGKQTLVNVKIYLKYERKVPKNMLKVVDAKVKEAAIKTLENNKAVIKETVEKYGNKNFMIPVPFIIN